MIKLTEEQRDELNDLMHHIAPDWSVLALPIAKEEMSTTQLALIKAHMLVFLSNPIIRALDVS